MCDFKGRNSAVILLGNSMCIVFVGGEPELGNREGLMKHTVQKSVIQNCNTILKTLMLMHQLVNLVQTASLYNMVRNKERNFICSTFLSTCQP